MSPQSPESQSPNPQSPEPKSSNPHGAPQPLDAVVIGEALVDIVARSEHVDVHPGGSPLNVAVGLARLDRPTALISTLGDDDHGDLVRRHLQSSSVVIDGIQAATATSAARATLAADGSASYDFDIAWHLEPATSLPPARMVHTGSIGAWMPPGSARVAELIENRAVGTFASFDPNIRASLVDDRDAVVARVERLAAAVDLVKLSDEDAAWLYPGRTDDDVLDHLRELGATVAVMTRGERGALAVSAAARVDIPAQRVTVVDTIGAGDAFMSGLIDAWLTMDAAADRSSESSLRALVARGTAAAAVVVGRAGADAPWLRELA